MGYVAADFMGMAETQLKKGNKRNACMFYSLAEKTTLNTWILRQASSDNIAKALKNNRDGDFSLKEPVTWQTDMGNSYTVFKIMPRVNRAALELQVSYITTCKLTNTGNLSWEAYDLGRYIVKNFPEFEEVCSDIVLVASERIPYPDEKIEAIETITYFEEVK